MQVTKPMKKALPLGACLLLVACIAPAQVASAQEAQDRVDNATRRLERIEDLMKRLEDGLVGQDQVNEIEKRIESFFELSEAQEPNSQEDRYLIGIMIEQAQPGEESEGVTVSQVLPEMPAAEAGIAAGDVILSVQDKEIESAEGLVELIRENGGEQLEVLVRRDDEELVVSLTPVKQEASDEFEFQFEFPDDVELPEGLELGEGGLRMIPPIQIDRIQDMIPELVRDDLRALIPEFESQREEVQDELDELRTEIAELRDQMREMAEQIRALRSQLQNDDSNQDGFDRE